MTTGCSCLVAFTDGELSAAEADSFREHLSGCARCRRRLLEDIQLRVPIEEAQRGGASWWTELLPPAVRGTGAGGGPGPRPIPIPIRRQPPLLWGSPALAVAAAAALLFIVRAPRAPRGEPPETLASLVGRLGERHIEPRLAEFSPGKSVPLRSMMGASAAPPRTPSSAILDELQQSADRRAVAIGALLSGEGREAVRRFEALGRSPDTLIDTAAAALVARNPESALQLLESLPPTDHDRPAAEWNRALAYRDLGLSTIAADSFARVAAQGESGWAAEARDREQEIRRTVDARRDGWRAARQAGESMVTGGPATDPETARRFPGITRLYFNEALCAAPTRDRARALAPLAAALDEHHGGTVLQQAVARVARADEGRRAPVAAGYQRLVEKVRLARPVEVDAAALLAAARAAQQEDIVLGALVLTSGYADHQAEFDRLAAGSGDPWMVTLGHQLWIERTVLHGDLLGAENELLPALKECRQGRLDYRCAYLESQLARIDRGLDRAVDAHRVVTEGLTHAQAQGEWALEAMFLQELADLARFMGQTTAAAAFLSELRARARSP